MEIFTTETQKHHRVPEQTLMMRVLLFQIKNAFEQCPLLTRLTPLLAYRRRWLCLCVQPANGPSRASWKSCRVCLSEGLCWDVLQPDKKNKNILEWNELIHNEKSQRTHIFQVFDEKITQTQIMADFLVDRKYIYILVVGVINVGGWWRDGWFVWNVRLRVTNGASLKVPHQKGSVQCVLANKSRPHWTTSVTLLTWKQSKTSVQECFLYPVLVADSCCFMIEFNSCFVLAQEKSIERIN